MAIVLSQETEELLRQHIESGAYEDVDTLVRAGIYALQINELEDPETLAELRAEIQIGLDQADRGETLPFDPEAIRREALLQLAKEREDDARVASK